MPLGKELVKCKRMFYVGKRKKESGQSCGPVIVSLGPIAADLHTKAKVKL